MDQSGINPSLQETQGTILWYDIETYGSNFASSPLVQFGAVRTDTQLNVLDEINLLCKPPVDMLIDPETVTIHNISPLTAQREGMPEAEFARRIYSEINQPNTCSVGYNSVSFDNEFIRFLFFRNLLPAYWHEYKDGCSKWDLLDVVRLISVIEPAAIKAPIINDKASYKLANIAKENDIAEHQPHDAFGDVEILLALAQQIKQAVPQLYNFCFNSRGKNTAQDLMRKGDILLNFSSRFSGAYHGGGIICPIAPHPTQKNSYICFDIRYSPQDLLQLSADEARSRHFQPKNPTTPDPAAAPATSPAATNHLPTGIKAIRLNHCPALMPWDSNWDESKTNEIFSMLQLDRGIARSHLKQLKENRAAIVNKIAAIYDEEFDSRHNNNELNNNELNGDKEISAEQSLYGGGFISDKDLQVGQQIHQMNADELKNLHAADEPFMDKRLNEILVRFKGRNLPDSLSSNEMAIWQEHCAKIHDEGLQPLIAATQQLIAANKDNPQLTQSLAETLSYLENLQHIKE